MNAELALYAFRETAASSATTRPRWGTLAHAEDPRKDPYALAWEATDPPRASSRPRTIWTDSQGSSHGGDRANLERAVPGLRPESWAVLEVGAGDRRFWVDKAAGALAGRLRAERQGAFAHAVAAGR